MTEGARLADANLLTVGHSNTSLERLLQLLTSTRVDVLVDVRSSPYSSVAPQFGRESLENALLRSGIVYVFEGRALGGRPEGAEYYGEDGRVLYFRMADAQWFLAGLNRLRDMATQRRLAIMCSEENPTNCHRHLLIARVLEESGVSVTHLRADGSLQPYAVMPDVSKRRRETPNLFPAVEDIGWKSTRSVSPSTRPSSSSAP
jgi:uncharacterized protein (DUF488 family)